MKSRRPPSQTGAEPSVRRLDELLPHLRRLIGNQPDLVIRTLPERDGPNGPEEWVVVYCSSLIAHARMEQHLLSPLLRGAAGADLPVGQVTPVARFSQALKHLMRGHALIFRPGQDALACELQQWPSRQIAPPELEPGTRGPNEALVEILSDNIGLVRLHLPDPRLRVEEQVAGDYTRTAVVVVYLQGLADPDLVAEVHRRLKAFQSEESLDASDLEQALADPHASILPTVQVTQRPDTIARACLEGRVAILSQGSGQALLIPGLLFHHLQASDDYYHKPVFTVFARFLRVTAILIATFLPGIYLALVSFHQEALPTTLLISIISAREAIPYPVFVEAIVMLLLFELFREAGLRMPKAVGPAVTIVGGLVIGEAAIRANLTSAMMLIAVATTAIASFAVPSLELASAVTYVRLLALILGGIFGATGLLLVYLAVLVYVNGLEPYGYPWLFPMQPLWPRPLAELTGLTRLFGRAAKKRQDSGEAGGREKGWRVP